MDPERLQDLLLRFPTRRIAVLGDFFLDKYLDIDAALAEVSVETGRLAHQVVSVRRSPGAAGTIVNNLAALGAGSIHALGFTGDDGEGYDLRAGLQALGCDVRGLFPVAGRVTPTYLKPRDVGNPSLTGEHERYDTKNRTPTPVDVQDKVIAHLAMLLPALDAVVVLDQVEEPECGLVTERLRERLSDLAWRNPSKIFWADSRHRVGRFRGLILKVNAAEAVLQVFGPQGDPTDDGQVAHAATRLAHRAGKRVFVTAGRRGIWVSHPKPRLVPGVCVAEPTDPTGAGDSATAAAVLALCAGATTPEAALVANLVASITVQQLATTGTASPADLLPRLDLWRRQHRA